MELELKKSSESLVRIPFALARFVLNLETTSSYSGISLDEKRGHSIDHIREFRLVENTEGPLAVQSYLDID